jgi:hypothetical protein
MPDPQTAYLRGLEALNLRTNISIANAMFGYGRGMRLPGRGAEGTTGHPLQATDAAGRPFHQDSEQLALFDSALAR